MARFQWLSGKANGTKVVTRILQSDVIQEGPRGELESGGGSYLFQHKTTCNVITRDGQRRLFVSTGAGLRQTSGDEPS